jgi:Tfp pilus assembly protein PilF
MTSSFPAYLGIAQCWNDLGDKQKSLVALLAGADRFPETNDAPFALYLAARTAEKLGDSATVKQITDRLAAKFPGSSYTTRLVGHEVLPAPAI